MWVSCVLWAVPEDRLFRMVWSTRGSNHSWQQFNLLLLWLLKLLKERLHNQSVPDDCRAWQNQVTQIWSSIQICLPCSLVSPLCFCLVSDLIIQVVPIPHRFSSLISFRVTLELQPMGCPPDKTPSSPACLLSHFTCSRQKTQSSSAHKTLTFIDPDYSSTLGCCHQAISHIHIHPTAGWAQTQFLV